MRFNQRLLEWASKFMRTRKEKQASKKSINTNDQETLRAKNREAEELALLLNLMVLRLKS
ncbi:MAG: hypothetical protein RRA45_08840 [Saccharolobus sp.]|uniref:hypothetical protein n=1 Tax=Saccharolobus sp. TaxID=2100761 RepID=UPI0028CC65C0|nr:hypothetical protein [Saccharolobus sp.]MDT7862303.1 hypothetical protein [Saccharolobus sp.]